MLLFYIIEIHI